MPPPSTPEPLGAPPDPPLEFVSYAAFGEDFFRHAVTTERVLSAVGLLTGQPIAIGPTPVGPGGLVRFKARGSVGQATSEELRGPTVSHRVTLPVSLTFEIDMGLERQQFAAELWVPVVLNARAAEGLLVFLDITPPRRGDIRIELQARGLRAAVLQRVAGLEDEVRRFVASYVAREIDKPYVRKACTIDVAAAIDLAWERLAPSAPSDTAAHIAEDFEEAAAEEVREQSHVATSPRRAAGGTR